MKKILVLFFMVFNFQSHAQTLEEMLDVWVNDAPNGFHEAIKTYDKDGGGYFVEIENTSKIFDRFYAEIIISEQENWSESFESIKNALDSLSIFKIEGWKTIEWTDGQGDNLTKGKNYELYIDGELTHFISLFYGDNYTGEREVVGLNISAKCKKCEIEVASVEN